jgi:CubicO group peptidase (beta-lactamase class C family)
MKRSTRSLLAFATIAAVACSEPQAATTSEASTNPPKADQPTRPRSRGIDAALMQEVGRQAEALPRLRSVIVARHGSIVAEHHLRGPGLDQAVNIKSASKSVISALVGIAIERDVLAGPDQKIAPLLRADIPAGADPRIEAITIGNLLSMQAGLSRTSGQNYGAWVASPNWVRYALSQPFEEEPGGRMLYSTGSSHLLSAILTRASGRSTHQLAQEWLAEPLGISLPP